MRTSKFSEEQIIGFLRQAEAETPNSTTAMPYAMGFGTADGTYDVDALKHLAEAFDLDAYSSEHRHPFQFKPATCSTSMSATMMRG